MLDRESVKKYFSQYELGELKQHLQSRVDKGNNDPVEIEIDKLMTLIEQALRPAWFHGFLGKHGMVVVLEPRYPDGCPEYGLLTYMGDQFHLDVCGYMSSEDMIEMLEKVEEGALIPPTDAIEFIMQNPTLMKGFKHWVKQRQKDMENDR